MRNAVEAMYLEYFGLKEKGFAITPDPHYLYLSDEHREALAHLLYGTGEGGGFVLLTGEVGTGKTTICRTFLEQLPEEVDVALILNPALTVTELLYTICEEFGIDVPVDVQSTKGLVDCLNRYLLEAHANGRQPVLMIDEAQNLSSDVLEQVRLLTNLETHHHKLLQIFLVGQPELKSLLDQEELRQLAQRITARFHLIPLSAKETRKYIRHRLAVAGAERNLFTTGAERLIFKLSGGIPRLINILCDRALLGAYATQRYLVDRKIVSKAARELKGEQQVPVSQRWLPIMRAWVPALLVIGVIGWWVNSPVNLKNDLFSFISPDEAEAVSETPPVDLTKVPDEEEVSQLPPAEPVPVAMQTFVASLPDTLPASLPEDEMELPDLTPAAVDPEPLASLVSDPVPVENLMQDQRTAMTLLLESWGVTYASEEDVGHCQFAQEQGLRCRLRKSNWNKLLAYDRPAVIKLINSEGATGYALIVGMGKDYVIVADGDRRIKVPMTRLDPFWFGDFLFLWKPPEGDFLVISSSSSDESVTWLRELLVKVPGWSEITSGTGAYDQQLKEVIQRFQGHRGLVPDGVVGPETLIQLNTAASVPGVPHLERLQ